MMSAFERPDGKHQTSLVFDTHAHLIGEDWSSYPPRALSPDLPPPAPPPYSVTAEALIAMMNEQGVAKAALVQRGHIYGYDNSYIIDSARQYPDRLHPVVILDPRDPQSAPRYRAMVREDGVAGFRMAQSRPWFLDTGWLCSLEAMELWKACADLGTPLTIIVFMNHLVYQLPLIKLIAGMFPDLPIILDHGAMPFGMTQYEVGLAQEAGNEVAMPDAPHFGIDDTIAIFEDVPNVFFKITEINMERLTKAGVRPARLVRRMVDSFGPQRLMWGSDIGQSMLWSYAEKVAMAKAAAEFLSDEEARGFLHYNAASIYRV